MSCQFGAPTALAEGLGLSLSTHMVAHGHLQLHSRVLTPDLGRNQTCMWHRYVPEGKTLTRVRYVNHLKLCNGKWACSIKESLGAGHEILICELLIREAPKAYRTTHTTAIALGYPP